MDQNINDNLIKQLFFKNKENRSHLMINRKILKNIPSDILVYLDNRFNDSDSTIETIKRIYYGIELKPCCPVCGNKLKFIGMPSCMFPITCSCKCNLNYIKTRDKIKETCLDRYGVEYSWQAEITKLHILETMIQKYGVVVPPYKNKDIKEKGKETCLDRYGVENGGGSLQAQLKIKETCLERYGVTSALASNHILEKIRETNLQ